MTGQTHGDRWDTRQDRTNSITRGTKEAGIIPGTNRTTGETNGQSHTDKTDETQDMTKHQELASDLNKDQGAQVTSRQDRPHQIRVGK